MKVLERQSEIGWRKVLGLEGSLVGEKENLEKVVQD